MITLLKHEMLRTRWHLGAAAATLGLVGVLGALLALAPWEWLATLGAMAAAAALILVVPAAMVVLVADYWQSSYGRGAVLTHSLPVRGSRIFTAKLIHGCGVMLAALLVALGLGFLLAWATISRETVGGQSALARLLDVVGEVAAQDGALWAFAAVAVVLSTWGYLVALYFSVSLGKEPWMARLGAAGPVVVAVSVYVVMQLLVMVGMFAVPFGMVYEPGLAFSVVPIDLWGAMRTGHEVSAMPLGVVVTCLAVPVALMWRTARSWNRHVSVR